MATTTSFGESPDSITAIDGTLVRSSNINITYDNLSVPATATVNGITVTWNGGYSEAVDAGEQVMLVAYAGSSNSSILAPNETDVPYYSNIGQITFGGSTNLWGLTWTPAQAEAINTKMFTSGFGKTFYHDAFQVTIHFSLPGDLTGGMLSISQGKVVIGPGKIVL